MWYFPLSSTQFITLKLLTDPPQSLNEHHNHICPTSYSQQLRNLIVGLMPKVDRQQHIFQAGKICQLLVALGCSLSLEKKGLRIR